MIVFSVRLGLLCGFNWREDAVKLAQILPHLTTVRAAVFCLRSQRSTIRIALEPIAQFLSEKKFGKCP
jgi:hypothetical protein